MRILIFFLVLVFALPAAAAEDECTLSTDALESHIDLKDPSIKTTLPVKRENRHLTESVILQNGITFSFDVGGCVHYAFTMTWDNVPADMEPNPITLVKQLLESAPLKKEDGENGERGTMRRVLQQATAPGFLPCGDATCELTVDKQPGDKRQVVLSYDFAL